MGGALKGIRIADFSRMLPGPYCTMILGDLGAEVIKIEPPGLGDNARYFPPFVEGESAYFMSVNRGKKSFTLDLNHIMAREIIYDLVRVSDVVVENFKVGTMEKLGFGYNRLKEINPSLVYASISGYGHTGPNKNRGSYEMIIQATSGMMSITGEEGGPAVRVGISIADLAPGLFAAIGILSALHVRNHTGQGQMVDVAMMDSQIALLENAVARFFATGEVPRRMGTRHPSIAPLQAFPTRDNWIVILCVTQKLWIRLCNTLGISWCIDDPRFLTNNDRVRNVLELEKIISAVTVTKDTDEWLELLAQQDIPAAPINTIKDAVFDPQVLAREMIVEVEHIKAGRQKVVGNPIKLSETPGIIKEAAPLLGQHNRWVLQDILGYDNQKLIQIADSKVLGIS
jgi:CoA:oxalate CoA-transferase